MASPRFARTLGGSILVEAQPSLRDLSLRYGGLERVEPGSPRARRVVVREFDPRYELELPRFERWVAAMRQLRGAPVPALRTYGRDGRPRVLVSDRIEGITLGDLSLAFPERGIPVHVALAATHALLPMCRRAVGLPRVLLGRSCVWVTANGEVQAWPVMEEGYVWGDGGCDGLVDEFGVPAAVIASNERDIGAMGLMLYDLLSYDREVHGNFPPHVLVRPGKVLPRVRQVRPEVPDSLAQYIDRSVAAASSDKAEPHRCGVSKSSHGSIDSWDALDRAIAEWRALVPPAGPDELRGMVRSLSPAHRAVAVAGATLPSLDEITGLPDAGYVAIPWERIDPYRGAP